MFLVLEYIYTKMKKDLSRKLLVIDEAWSLLRQAHEASYVFEIVKTCRKFNMALFLINQEVEGMLESEAGKSVLANSSYTLLLRQKPAVINNVKRAFFLSDSEVNHLLTASPGEGLLIMEDEHSEIKIIASPEEHNSITTNADELLNLREAETEEQRKKNLQVKINIRNEKRKELDKEEIEVSAEESCVKLNDLSTEEVEYLKSEGYKEYKFQAILAEEKEKYLIKPRKKESPQHIFLIYDICTHLRKMTDKIDTYQTVKPDILFKMNDKEYAIEVETGKLLSHNKKALKNKIKNLKKQYADRWFFVVTNRNLAPAYNKLGPTYEKRTVIQALSRLATKK
jgi:hypothetical protein